MRIDSHLLLAIGIHGNRSVVGDRIELLLRRGRKFSPRASETGIVVSVMALGVLLLASSFAPGWIAFAQQQPAARFEVASIHRNTSGDGGSLVDFPETGRLTVSNATIRTLIRNAWGIQNERIESGAGAAKPLDVVRYDIQAKTSQPIREDQEAKLLQNLLAERFHLAVHHETRVLPYYALLVGKSGRKFKENSGPDGVIHTSRGPERIEISGTRISMPQLARMLGTRLSRVVRDETGLTGNYELTLSWAPDEAEDTAAPSLFEALREQLGLRLESSKGPVEVLVVDHVEQPDAD